MKQSSNDMSSRIATFLSNHYSTGNLLKENKNDRQIAPKVKQVAFVPKEIDINKQNSIITKRNKTQLSVEQNGVLKSENIQNSLQPETIDGQNNVPIRGKYAESQIPTLPPAHGIVTIKNEQKPNQKKTHFNQENLFKIHEKEKPKPKVDIMVDQLKKMPIASNSKEQERQGRIDGQIKKYMDKIGLHKKDRFPVFYTIDENGKEVKTSLSDPANYHKYTNQQQPYFFQQKQTIAQNSLTNEEKKIKKGMNEEEEKLRNSKNENLQDIMKICNQMQKTIATFDRKSSKNVRRQKNDFKKLNDDIKQFDLQNFILQEQADPALQPYMEHIKNQGRLREPSLKNILKQ